MTAKKILTIINITLLIATVILGIITLVNYYSYVNILNKLTHPDTDLITKFELQESRDKFLYKTLTTTIYTCYVAIITAITSISNLIINRAKKNSLKIR